MIEHSDQMIPTGGFGKFFSPADLEPTIRYLNNLVELIISFRIKSSIDRESTFSTADFKISYISNIG